MHPDILRIILLSNLCIFFTFTFGVAVIWSDETKYDQIIDLNATSFGVPASLIKAVIAKESSFRPQAFKSEPHIKDASRGLMQVLLQTARNLGFKGKADDLFDPKLNIYYGTYLLSQNLKTAGGKVNVAVAAYNAGWSKVRKGDAPRKPDMTFVNQSYVDDVQVYFAYFSKRITEQEAKEYIRSKKFPGILTAGVFF